ncbi:MAG: polyketide synthase, partial [bacterium]|nr:polyketide synthase [bacterium]
MVNNSQEPSDAHHESEIAVIGISGRFPGSANRDQFRRNLREAVESISFFSEEELAASGVAPALYRRPDYVPARGILEDVDLFDAALFDIPPGEAELTDCQHRIFLECAWEALEDAGYDPEQFPGAVGVFAGSSQSTYAQSLLRDGVEEADRFRIGLGGGCDHLAPRVSYTLNLTGPSINVQTACSTSLVAVHMACQSLLSGESELALAGGVSIAVPIKAGYRHYEGGILSPDGHCRAFDAGARGTVAGTGAGVVVLKRLEPALADGDVVHAVIKGSAVNNDGRAKVGYTAPGGRGQAAVVAEALAVAGVDPETIGYLEAHGTGTQLGDPVEIAALTRAFRRS